MIILVKIKQRRCPKAFLPPPWIGLKVIQGRIKGNLKKFKGWFKGVSKALRKFQESVKYISGKFIKKNKSFSRMLYLSFVVTTPAQPQTLVNQKKINQIWFLTLTKANQTKFCFSLSLISQTLPQNKLFYFWNTN